MNATLALARLKLAVQDTVEPTLSAGELDTLLTFAATVDADGNEPQDDAYTPTYSAMTLNLAIAEGWAVKAAKLGAGENFSSDGATFDPQTRRAFCLDQAATFRKKVSGSAVMLGRTGRFDTTAGIDLVVN